MSTRLATLADAPVIRDAWNRVRNSIAAWWPGGVAEAYDDPGALAVIRQHLRGYIAEDAVGPLGFYLVRNRPVPDAIGGGTADELELMIIGPQNWVQTTRGLNAKNARELRRVTALDLFMAWFTDAQTRGVDWYWGEGPPTTPAETLNLLETQIKFRTRIAPNGWHQWYGVASPVSEGIPLVQAAY